MSQQNNGASQDRDECGNNDAFSQLTLDDLKDKQIAGYTLESTIGRGSVAVVKYATHFATGKKAAIKIMRPKTIQEQKETIREIEILSRLRHPNIIKMYKVVRELGYTCLILEYAEQGELFDHVLEQGKFSEVKARTIFRQILSAVQYLHANLIVHRDIKPENILVDSEGVVKLSDFGLSNVLRPGKLFSTFCGSPIYTPPEVVLQQQYNGLQMDVWSLGVVLYVMVTGGMPWKLVQNRVQNMNDLINGNYKIPEFFGLSEECTSLIRRMVHADASKRATLEEVCNHPWVTKGFDCAPDANLTAKAVVPEPNPLIIDELVKLGIDPAQARLDVQTKPCSPALTTYHVLFEKVKHFQHTASIIKDETIINSPKSDLRRAVLTPTGHRRTQSHSSPSAPRRKVDFCAEAETKQVPAPIPEHILPAPSSTPVSSAPVFVSSGHRSVSSVLKSFVGKFKKHPAKPVVASLPPTLESTNIILRRASGINSPGCSPQSRRRINVQ